MCRLVECRGKIAIQTATDRYEMRSPKWQLFLAILMTSPSRSHQLVDVEYLMRFPTFSKNKDGRAKEKRTVQGEIGNFIRDKEKAGFDIFEYNMREQGGWGINHAKCPTDCEALCHSIIQSASQTVYETAFDFREDDHTFSAWCILVSTAKLDFMRGKIPSATRNLKNALKLSESTLLRLAVFSELARFLYRAEHDEDDDLRLEVMEAAEDKAIHPLLQDIYVPRITASFLFHRESRETADDRLHHAHELMGTYLRGVDVAGLCRAFNIAFITYQAAGDRRTLNDKSSALLPTRAATVLSMTVGDPDLIQSSIYNYALSLQLFADKEKTRAQQIDLYEHNYSFCEALSIGADTAQGSLSLAHCYLNNENLPLAKIALLRAMSILYRTENKRDLALFYSCAAEYAVIDAQNQELVNFSIARRRYESSIELYETIGRNDVAESIRMKLLFIN